MHQRLPKHGSVNENDKSCGHLVEIRSKAAATCLLGSRHPAFCDGDGRNLAERRPSAFGRASLKSRHWSSNVTPAAAS
jgi:hypothetical protein